jgi:hypothetical protein
MQMIARIVATVLVASASAHADLYAVTIGHGDIRYYRVSTIDASTELISSGHSALGILELTAGSDGHVYAQTIFDLELVDPPTGTSEFLEGSSSCWFTGALAAAVGEVFVGAGGPQCGRTIFAWNTRLQEFSYWFSLQGNNDPRVAEVRDDGRIALMRYADMTMYAVDPRTEDVEVIGAFADDMNVESLARDPVTGTTYMLGQAPGDPWSLYEIDLYTLGLTPIGPVEPRDIYAISGIPRCPADFNGDGVLNILDFVALQLAWQAGNGAADVNADGVLDVLDFVAFQGLFAKGC